MVVRFGVSPCGGDMDLGCLETYCRGEYIDLRQRKLQEDGGNYSMRSCVEIYGEVVVYLHAFLAWTLGEVEWQT